MAAFTYEPMVVSTTTAADDVGAWTPGTDKTRPTSTLGSDIRAHLVSYNEALYPLNNVLAALSGGEVPMSTATLAIGSTDTNISITASAISINAVGVVLAAATDEALGALGTIPAATWGLIKVQRVAAGTVSYVSAADNYTTGYATEALAIAAMPATTASRVAVGYLTVEAQSGNAWIAGTDALAGGTTGNQANATNYYSFQGAADTAAWANVLQVANKDGTVITSTAG